MAITENAKTVIERPLDPARIKTRQGGQGMTFDYIGTEHAIQLLNEAFEYAWDTTVISHEIFDGLAVALVELKVWDNVGSPIIKQQFGSCNINRGVDTGAALKGAASDGLKKCASQLGLALELYLDDTPAAGGFKAPTKPAPQQKPAPTPASVPAKPSTQAHPPAPQSPPARPPVTNAAPAKPSSFPAPPGGGNTASVPRPPAPVSKPPSRPAGPPAAASAAARPNPFERKDASKGITTVQMSALTTIAAKKGVSQPDLVALAGVVDGQGAPKQTFEELTHSEAIEVVKAAQR